MKSVTFHLTVVQGNATLNWATEDPRGQVNPVTNEAQDRTFTVEKDFDKPLILFVYGNEQSIFIIEISKTHKSEPKPLKLLKK